MGLKGSLLC